MPNRFSRYTPGSNYSPESFRDMSIVPIALRQRHDAALAAQDDMLLQLDNIQVRDEDREYYNQKRQEITSKVEDLTNKINTIGAGDSNLMGEFRNMKRSYNKEVSLSGGLGQAADVKKRIDDTRAKYLEFGVEQGFSPETTQKNFDVFYDEYKNSNPNTALGTEGFAFKEFNPTFAPKQVDALSIHKEGQGLLGKIAQDVAWQNYVPVTDANGQIHYQQTGGKRLSEDNLRNLQAYENFINQKILNPESDIRQSLRFSRPGVPEDQIVKDFLAESDFLSQAMRVKITGQMDQIEPPRESSGGGAKAKSPDEVAELVSIPTGQNTITGDFTETLNGTAIKAFEAKENTIIGLTEQESAQKTLAILQHDKLKSAVEDPNNKKKIDSYLNKNGVLKNGTVDLYRKSINIYDNQIKAITNTLEYQQATAAYNSGSYSPGEQGMALINKVKDLSNKKRELSIDLNEAIKTIIPNVDLQYSKLYTFGSSSTDKDGSSNAVKKAVDNSLNNNIGLDNILTYLNNGGGKFTDIGESEFKDKLNTDDFKEFSNALLTSNTQLEFDGLVDLGSTGSSQILLRYTKDQGNGKATGRMALDYDNKSTDTNVLDQLLDTIQGSVDLKGQAVIQSIKDNKKYKDLSVDSTEFAKTGWSGTQTNKIKKYSKEIDSNIRNNPRYKEVNYIDNFKDNNIILNQDGYYEMRLRNSDKSTGVDLKTGMWFQKDFVRDYQNGVYSTPNPLQPKTETDKVNFVRSMKDVADQLTDPENGVMQIGNNNSEFKRLREEFINAISTGNLTLAQQYQYAATFYNSMKDMKIALKNKKRIM